MKFRIRSRWQALAARAARSDASSNPALATTDPFGYTTTTQYNAVDQVTQVTDALNQTAKNTFDAAQRLTSVINQVNVAIESYIWGSTPGSVDRVTAHTDALGKATAYDSQTQTHQAGTQAGQVRNNSSTHSSKTCTYQGFSHMSLQLTLHRRGAITLRGGIL